MVESKAHEGPLSGKVAKAAGPGAGNTLKSSAPNDPYYSSDDSGGSDAESQKARGNFFFKKKRYDKAAGYFGNAIKMAPKTSIYYSNRAMCYNAKEEWSKGKDDALRAIELSKKEQDNALKAIELSKKEQQDSSIEKLQESEEVESDSKSKPPSPKPNRKAYHHACKSLFQLGEYERCLEIAGECLKLFSKDAANYAKSGSENDKDALSICKLMKDEWEKQCKQKISQKKKEQEDIKKMIDLEKARQDPDMEYKQKALDKAKQAYSKGDLMKSVEECQNVISRTIERWGKVHFNESSESSQQPTSSNVNNGEKLSDSKRNKDSCTIEDVTDQKDVKIGVSSLEKDDVKDKNLQVQSEQQKTISGTESQSSQTKILDLNIQTDSNSNDSDYSLIHMKHDMEAYRLLGKTFMRLQRAQEAYDSFRVELALHEKLGMPDADEHISTAHSNMGIAAKRLGKLDEALAHLQASLSKLTKNNELSIKNSTVANIMQNLGQVHMARKDLNAAKDAYQKSLEIQLSLYGPDHANVALGYLCLARLPDKDVQSRTELYDKVLKILDPQGDKTKLQKILSELPELPVADRVASLVTQVKKEKAALAGQS